MRQILAMGILGAGLAFSATTAFANDRDPVPAFDVDQSEAVLGVTESAPSMGSGINAPQPVQGPVSDREGNNR